MANKKKKKNRKHINRRKRAGQKVLQAEEKELEVQAFFSKRSLICVIVIAVMILLSLFCARHVDNFLGNVITVFSVGVIIAMIGVLFYRNYHAKAVISLYWGVVLSGIFSFYLLAWQGWMLFEFLSLTLLSVWACVCYMRENRKGARKFVKKGKFRKVVLDSFWPISMFLVFRAMVLFT